MAPIQPSWALENRQDHHAKGFRNTIAGIMPGPAIPGALIPIGGVHPIFGNRFNAVGSGSAMTVAVDTGLVFIPGAQNWQGLYCGWNDASYNVTIAPSTSQYRRDYIVAKQFDSAYGDGSDNWDIVPVQGTPSGSSPAPLPSLAGTNCTIIAVVNVDPNITNLNGKVTMARQWCNLPGPYYTTSAAKPGTTTPDGTMWVESDTHLLGAILGNSRQYVLTSDKPGSLQGTATNFSPLLYNGDVSISRSIGYAKYYRIGRLVFYAFDVVANATTTNGVELQLPVTAAWRQVIAGAGHIMGAGIDMGNTALGMNVSGTRLLWVGNAYAYQNISNGQAVRGVALYEGV